MLIPSTITALRTCRYTSTLYIHHTIHGFGYNPMNDGGRYSIQSPFVSNLPPAWSTLPPPITPPHEWVIGHTFEFTFSLPKPANRGGRPHNWNKPAYYATKGVVKRNHPTGLVVGRWLTAELEEPPSEAVTVTAEDDFDLIKFGRGPDRSNWTLKPGEAGLVEYNTNLHKITLNAGTSYNMKRRGDLRNDLAISIISANDSCDDQKFISGSGDFIQYDAGDENDGSEFTPLLHYSALNTRSDTDTATGTGECYIITVNYLHGHDQKFGPYSILVTEN